MKNETISFKLNSSERKSIEDNALKAKLTTSEYIRRACLNKEVIEKKTDTHYARQFSKFFSLINGFHNEYVQRILRMWGNETWPF